MVVGARWRGGGLFEEIFSTVGFYALIIIPMMKVIHLFFRRNNLITKIFCTEIFPVITHYYKILFSSALFIVKTYLVIISIDEKH